MALNANVNNKLFTFYIFNKFGDALFTRTWYRESAEEPGGVRLVAGLVYTLQGVMGKFVPAGAEADASYYSLSTPQYKLHYLDTPTGYRFVLTSAPNMTTSEGQELLHDIYLSLFTEFVAKHPSYRHIEVSPDNDDTASRDSGAAPTDSRSHTYTTRLRYELDQFLRARNYII